MKNYLIVILILLALHASAQKDSSLKSIADFQKSLIEEYSRAETSPLNADAKKSFKGIHFFEINKQLIIVAQFVRSPNEKPFFMNTSSGKRKNYIKYGEAIFKIDSKEYKLNIYQSLDLVKTSEYKEYLFIPFTDDTNGAETYEGGRYIDLTTPKESTILLDFNKAYQPYCAYTSGYNCPVPPSENYLTVKIMAGVRF